MVSNEEDGANPVWADKSREEDELAFREKRRGIKSSPRENDWGGLMAAFISTRGNWPAIFV